MKRLIAVVVVLLSVGVGVEISDAHNSPHALYGQTWNSGGGGLSCTVNLRHFRTIYNHGLATTTPVSRVGGACESVHAIVFGQESGNQSGGGASWPTEAWAATPNTTAWVSYSFHQGWHGSVTDGSRLLS